MRTERELNLGAVVARLRCVVFGFPDAWSISASEGRVGSLNMPHGIRYFESTLNLGRVVRIVLRIF